MQLGRASLVSVGAGRGFVRRLASLQMRAWHTDLTRRALARTAVAGALVLLCSSAAQAGALSPLPRSDYGVRSVCEAPAPGHVSCLALQLVPRTAAAQARTHPLGIRTGQAIRPGNAAQGADGLGPAQLRNAYFPGEEPNAPASQPQTIALVDPYNDLGAEAGLRVYDEAFSLPACTRANGCFEQINQNGSKGELPFPSSVTERHGAESLCEDPSAPEGERAAACVAVQEADGWSLEMSLDIEMAHAICQNCHIALVEADNSERASLEAAENTAARSRQEGGIGASEVSDSWGGREPAFDSEAFNHPGVVVTAASGDCGYLGWRALVEECAIGVNYPAASPHVVSVGGTSLTMTGEGGQAWGSESVWGGSGGGCSENFPAQAWQREVTDWTSVGCGTGSESKRASNDVAADADPYTGVAVYDSVPYLTRGEWPRNGSAPRWTAIGGTSVASPIVASMFALAGGSHGVAYPAQTLYSHLGSGLLHDITEEGNGECEGFYGDGCSGSVASSFDCGQGALICSASTGYDGPSGLGTPDGIGALAPGRPHTHVAGSPEAPLTEAACGEPVGATAAEACGTLDPHANATVGYYFAYNKGASCTGGRETALVSEAQRNDAAVSAQLVGLEPATEYSYCLVATDASGETKGSAVTFTTEPIAPRTPSTEAATHIATEAVTLEGRLTAEQSPTTWYFEYAPGGSCSGAGATRTPEAGDAHPGEQSEVSASVGGLEPGTEYSACLVAKNAAGSRAGSQISFTTKAITPRIVSVNVQAGTSEASLQGQILPGAAQASCQLEYGSTEAYGLRTDCNEGLIRSANSGAVANVHITGLEPGTAYDYRLIVENTSGPSAPGEGKGTFTTHIPTPLLSAESASEIGASSAALAGTIATEGTRTRYWFEYGATEALGQSTPGGEALAGPGEAKVGPEAISGLAPETVYFYRLRAANRWHEAFGPAQTFTTTSSSPSTPPSGPSNTSSGGSPMTSPSGSEPSGSLITPLSQPLIPIHSASTTAPKKAAKKVAKCKRHQKRAHERCVRRTKTKRAVGTRGRARR